MPKQWVYVTLLLFVLFLIWTDPGGAGMTARTFAGWLGSLATSAIDFLEGLFGNEGGGGGTQPSNTVGGGIDSFNPNPEN